MTIPLPPSVCRTYRYLRLSVVGLTLLLAVAVAWQMVGSGTVLGSVSAYFYTPVRSVFVGALIGVGAALIAIRGREGAENAMLNVAGMLAAVVALVPTPVSAAASTQVCGPGIDCAARSSEVVSAAAGNNIGALLIVGLVALVAVTIAELREPRQRRDPQELRERAGPPRLSPRLSPRLPPVIAIGWAVWAGATLWVVFGWPTFLKWGHLAAAAGLFGLIAAVAVINALAARTDLESASGRARGYANLYWAVAVVMACAIVIAVIAGAAGTAGVWLIWVEAALIAAFALFWLAQTIEFWHSGAPRGA